MTRRRESSLAASSPWRNRVWAAAQPNRPAGRRGFGRVLDIEAALIEPKRWVAVGHQHHTPATGSPTDRFQVPSQKARRITLREQRFDSRDQHTCADRAGGGIADGTAVLHSGGHDITGADKRTDDEILREREQPLDQPQPTIQLPQPPVGLVKKPAPKVGR
jgi:hypothetical protein